METGTLIQLLWPKGNGPDCPQVYALLDGARDDAIAPAIWLSNLPSTCLYTGKMSRSLERAAPYLVQLAPESRFFSTLVSEGWGQAWGVFVVAEPDVTLKELRKHFRTLLRVSDETGKVLAFRFYDPRVLRPFIPTCDRLESELLYGPVQAFGLECANGAGLELIERGARGLGKRRNFAVVGNSLKIRGEQLVALRRERVAMHLHSRLQSGMHLRNPHLSASRKLSISDVRHIMECAYKVGLTEHFTAAAFVLLVCDDESPQHISLDILTLICRGENPDQALKEIIREIFVDEILSQPG